MKSLIALVLAIVVGAVCIAAGDARASTVPCPSGPRTAKIVEPPAGWNAVPDTSGFTSAAVTGSGPSLSLVCTYGEAGRLESDLPPGERVCTVSGARFACRRAEGTLELGEPMGTRRLTIGDSVDLDTPTASTTKLSFNPIKVGRGKPDFIFAELFGNRNQPGYDLENNVRASPFTKRFPLPSECPRDGTTSSGIFFPIFDPGTENVTRSVFYACVTSEAGYWYLTRLSDIDQEGFVAHATLTWWRF